MNGYSRAVVCLQSESVEIARNGRWTHNTSTIIEYWKNHYYYYYDDLATIDFFDYLITQFHNVALSFFYDYYTSLGLLVLS